MDSVGAKSAGRKVLIADDDPVTRSVIGQSFQNGGYSVVATTDGIEACSLAEANMPDIALIDLLLPRRDGYSVLLYLRAREATRGIPIMILSGESSEEHPGIARALGAQAYVTKPFDPKSVVQTAKEILSGRHDA